MAPRPELIGLLMLATLTTSAAPTSQVERDTVVVLHGMGRTKLSMAPLANELRHQGFEVINFSYPSTRRSIAESSELLRRQIAAVSTTQNGRIHFVTHSLGGIVVRAMLKEYRPAKLGRVVMLSPPNQGSELADRLRSNFVYRLATGPAGQELGTNDASTPNTLGAVDFPLGVITGNRSLNPLFSAWIPGPDDGKVSVSRAPVDGMTDFLVVPHSHSFIMRSPQVGAQVVHFLRHGQFEHPRT